MDIYLLSAVTNVAKSVPQEVTNTETFWNATNILANILVAVITAVVAWKVAKVNTNAKSLSYSLKIYPILDYKFRSENSNAPLKEIMITYDGAILENPCLVIVEVINSGNKGIENPPILISNNENIEMIPLEVDEVPKGYSWKIETETPSSCKISASLINPKQKLRASFFMSSNPKEELEFSCAMCDLQCHEISGTVEKDKKEKSAFKIPYGAVLGGITVFLILLLQTEMIIDIKSIISNAFEVPSICFDIYVISIPILALILSVLVPRKINILILKHHLLFGLIAMSLFVIASIFLYMILRNILFSDFFKQMIIGAISAFLYSCSIHIFHLYKN